MSIFDRLSEHRREDGTYDWAAYGAMERATGGACMECNRFILFKSGKPTTCSDCRAMVEDDDVVTHDGRIRCPACGRVEEVDFEHEIYEEGSHDVSCGECDHDYEVQTVVSYSFESPERLESTDD